MQLRCMYGWQIFSLSFNYKLLNEAEYEVKRSMKIILILAKVDNSLRDLHNSLHGTKAKFNT